MKMTVEELIGELQNFDPNSEVRIASLGHRSHFEYSLDDIVEVQSSDPDEAGFVYLAGGSQIGYLNGKAREELGV